MLPHVDFEEATRLAVGRAWTQATPEQKKKLVTEFRNMLVRTYSNAISAYEGQTMKVMPVRMKPGDTEVTVHNQFVRPGSPKPVLIDYSMRKTEKGWKIYDIVVEGVSLVLTYRSEFDAHSEAGRHRRADQAAVAEEHAGGRGRDFGGTAAKAGK